MLQVMNTATAATKAHVRKKTVLGAMGMKRKLADLLITPTGQQLKYFDDVEAAKDQLEIKYRSRTPRF